MQQNSYIRSDSNQRFHALHGTSLPATLSIFSTHKMRLYKFVCEYIAYFQSFIYFQTELLTLAKFSLHVWTGFCGPTGDGKWSHHKGFSIYFNQKFKQISSVSGFADIASVV